MNHFNKFRQNVLILIITTTFLPTAISASLFVVLAKQLDNMPIAIISSVLLLLVLLITFNIFLYNSIIKPLDAIWKAVWHVSPGKSEIPPPSIENIHLGHDMVSSIVMQIYDLASTNKLQTDQDKDNEITKVILDSLPIGLLIFDKESQLKLVNSHGATLCGQSKDDLVKKNIYEILNLSFDNENTLDKWLADASANKITDETHWDNVKLDAGDNSKRLDISAKYSKNDSADNELIIVLTDKTDYYSSQEKSISYVSMAVHELRTPLTMLRGYIELFEEEISGQLDEEHLSFMRKMSATSQNLNAIVSNILNVSRINENEFNLQLSEDNWDTVLREIINSMELRAKVRQKHITLDISPNLPTVGIDKISMYEVVVNLVDNAIKYSGQSDTITVSSRLANDGNVETVVKDDGPGIPTSVVGGLFTKFYRSHRSKDTVGGNGLGLYIVKSIVTAHGGQVWVKSKEGQGSEFGFTIIPYANLEEAKANGQDTIVRQANGWIKNHSLYRR